MPELPEVETLRRALQSRLHGHRIVKVDLHRRDIVRGSSTRSALLKGRRIDGFVRHGKQLAMLAAGGPPSCVCFHLGMSGTLILHLPSTAGAPPLPHTHAIWYLDDERAVHFRDPRRFGGIWTFPDIKDLQRNRWDTLGPDALAINSAALHDRLRKTKRALKSALLDQQCIAGLGNIYIDELLFRCRLHPLVPAENLQQKHCIEMVHTMRKLLRSAVRAGGSTLRDYRDASGRKGHFQEGHLVYGRAGEPCVACGLVLRAIQVAARTTVFCNRCQSLRRGTRALAGHR